MQRAWRRRSPPLLRVLPRRAAFFALRPPRCAGPSQPKPRSLHAAAIPLTSYAQPPRWQRHGGAVSPRAVECGLQAKQGSSLHAWYRRAEAALVSDMCGERSNADAQYVQGKSVHGEAAGHGVLSFFFKLAPVVTGETGAVDAGCTKATPVSHRNPPPHEPNYTWGIMRAEYIHEGQDTLTKPWGIQTAAEESTYKPRTRSSGGARRHTLGVLLEALGQQALEHARAAAPLQALAERVRLAQQLLRAAAVLGDLRRERLRRGARRRLGLPRRRAQLGEVAVERRRERRDARLEQLDERRGLGGGLGGVGGRRRRLEQAARPLWIEVWRVWRVWGLGAKNWRGCGVHAKRAAPTLSLSLLSSQPNSNTTL